MKTGVGLTLESSRMKRGWSRAEGMTGDSSPQSKVKRIGVEGRTGIRPTRCISLVTVRRVMGAEVVVVQATTEAEDWGGTKERFSIA